MHNLINAGKPLNCVRIWSTSELDGVWIVIHKVVYKNESNCRQFKCMVNVSTSNAISNITSLYKPTFIQLVCSLRVVLISKAIKSAWQYTTTWQCLVYSGLLMRYVHLSYFSLRKVADGSFNLKFDFLLGCS